MTAVEQGRAREFEGPELDPDRSIRDLDEYLRSVRKDPFDVDDDNVVLIDPGMAAVTRYSKV